MTGGLLFLLVGATLANIILTFYLFRRSRLPAKGVLSGGDLEAQTERILTEIHRVTSANVELLEGRIDALREVGVVADERLKRIRATLTDLEVLLNRIHRIKKSVDGSNAPDATESSPPPAPDSMVSSAAPQSRSESARMLQRQGLTDAEIAQRMGMGLAEVRFLLKLAGAAKVPVETT